MKKISRDKENQRKLIELGWRVEVVWECETKDWYKFFSKLSGIFPSMFDVDRSLERLETEEIQELIETMKESL